MDAKVIIADVRFVEHEFVHPLVISSGTISCLSEAQAEVVVRVGDVEAAGRGSSYLSDLWAWPDGSLSHAEKDRRLRSLCHEIAVHLGTLCGDEAAHPLELGMRLHESVCRGDGLPVLARLMCASPFDAAIHDAVGIALQVSAYDLYNRPVSLPSIEDYLEGSACRAIKAVIGRPRRRLKAWYLVGMRDDLRSQVVPLMRQAGYRCIKIKLLGRDNKTDVARTVEVFRELTTATRSIELSVDTNEANPDSASVLDYLCRLREADPQAFDALKYLEQPTHRDILAHHHDWHAVSRMKPVLLDEGLTSLDLLDEAMAQGWSGLALKTCKGHSFALTAAAAARQRGMAVALQDLTNPGLAFIHAALFASRVRTINDVELNSPQFTPAANAAWERRLPELFRPRHGVHRLPKMIPPGLGSAL
ncbi:MAG TPA: hypothetical protein DCX07_13975 [Phycisphaerales bacterium]|nr:hypothetical protein [Phycisphaerales bacterium]